MEGQLWCYAFWMDKTTVTGWAFNLCLNNEMEEGKEWFPSSRFSGGMEGRCLPPLRGERTRSSPPGISGKAAGARRS